jgi:hypothetical protein
MLYRSHNNILQRDSLGYKWMSEGVRVMMFNITLTIKPYVLILFKEK